MTYLVFYIVTQILILFWVLPTIAKSVANSDKHEKSVYRDLLIWLFMCSWILLIREFIFGCIRFNEVMEAVINFLYSLVFAKPLNKYFDYLDSKMEPK